MYLPKKNSSRPAMIIELKWEREADAAIEQIKNRFDDAMEDVEEDWGDEW